MNRNRRVFPDLLLLTAIIAVAGSGARAADRFFLSGGETIVFFGDSITQSGEFVTYVEAYLLTRFPDKTFRVINHGISSETVSGTSEPDHDPPRPNALARFTRDIAEWKPDVVVACFGMNDGNYRPFEIERFQKYQAGVRELIRRTKEEAHARLVLMTPPPFDPNQRQVLDPKAKSFGYRFPAVDYDETLAEYSRWLLSLREEGFVVADVHSSGNAHLRRRRERNVRFALAPDGVHPNPTGHWLMAQTLLRAWQAPVTVSEIQIDAEAGPKGDVPQVADFESRAESISWTWRSPLPLPRDPRWDGESLSLEQTSQRLNWYRLKVSELPSGRYRLLADGQKFAEVSRLDLDKGIDLTAYPELPTGKRAAELFPLLQERQKLTYAEWRKSIKAPLAKQSDEEAATESKEAEKRIAELTVRIEELRRPIRMRMQIVPARVD